MSVTGEMRDREPSPGTLERLLETAVAENESLRRENQRLKYLVDHQAEMMRGAVAGRMEERKNARAEDSEDEACFRMMRERPEISEGCLRVVVPTERIVDGEVDDLPEAMAPERNIQVERVMFGVVMALLIIAILVVAFIKF